MSGEQFAEYINKELNPTENKVGVIAKNPAKSKHLETATMFIEGMPIDFVNLRSEKYCEDSRVPEIVIILSHT